MSWNREDLFDQLNDQLRNLAINCLEFDRGNQSFGLPIASILRVIFHHHPGKELSTHSLVHQLNLEHETFISSLQDKSVVWFRDKDDKVFSNTFWLCHMEWRAAKFRGSMFGYTPHLDRIESENMLCYEEWWAEVVINYQRTETLTRKSLVTLFANKLGGSHYQVKLSDNQKNIQSLAPKAIGWNFFNKGVEGKVEESPYLLSLRQIAHETFLSFDKILDNKLDIYGYYFSKIETYNQIGYNYRRWKNWMSLIKSIQEMEQKCVLLTMRAIDKKFLLAISTETIGDDPNLDMKKLKWTTIIDEFGKMHVLVDNVSKLVDVEYRVGDRVGMLLTALEGESFITFFKNEKEVIKVKCDDARPLYISWAYEIEPEDKDLIFISGLNDLKEIEPMLQKQFSPATK